MIAAAVLAALVASPTGMTAVNIAGFLLNYIVLPCLFWKGPLPTRLICGFLLVATQFAGELLLGVVFSLAGVAFDRDAGGLFLLAMRLVNIALILGVGWVLGNVVRRTIGRAANQEAQGTQGAEPEAPQAVAVWRYGVFLLPQLAFLVVSSMSLMSYRDTEPQTYVLILLAAVACLAVDAVALLAFRRALAAKRAAAQAEALEQQLALHTENARAMDAEAQRAARFRHDQRNHLQTVLGLVERGQTDRAAEYVAELRRQLTEGEEAK